mgnify:CR=1 FL=1|jgi:hypothetical protein
MIMGVRSNDNGKRVTGAGQPLQTGSDASDVPEPTEIPMELLKERDRTVHQCRVVDVDLAAGLQHVVGQLIDFINVRMNSS